ncbi:MAG: 23S rRNA (uracil(1939)-C(5))-methyltransferase RlmD, partial [Lachnospiraceae bacterium]
MIQKNDLIQVKIEDISSAGEGIGKYEGMTFFIKDTVIGDIVTAKIMKLKKTYGYARLMEILEASPDRVEPQCSYARACGGCQLQAMSYKKQLDFKYQKVRNHLIRIGGFSADQLDSITDPIVGMQEPYHYRNKAQFPVGINASGDLVAGFYAGRTHTIIPNLKCGLLDGGNELILSEVLDYMRLNHISAYDEATQIGLVRHVLIRYGFHSGEWMVCLVINGTSLPLQEKLIAKLMQIEGMTSISYNCNKANTNVILGEKTVTIAGKSTISDSLFLRNTKTKDFGRMEEFTSFQISPQSFYQVNPEQTEKLYSLALEYAALTGRETVWDLYCGIGTISLFLARHAKKVYGVEIIPQAIQDAQNNAKLNQIENAEFFTGKAEEILPEHYRTTNERAEVIIVDPPRKGCDIIALETMLKMRPDRIVYVSCDSATLARDLKILCEGGYELKRVRPVDQFPHTVHVET